MQPAKRIEDAMTEICELAKRKRVGVLIDAEQSVLQAGIDLWMLRYQRKYNKGEEAVVYGTYQAYLQSTPETLSQHLSTAQDEGFTLGVKLVRGAYMGSDLPHLFWSTKEATDRTYNGVAAALIQCEYNDVLRSPAAKNMCFPKSKLVLATHNHTSVQKAMELQKEQATKRQTRLDLCYGQLMGMADEVSCELVMAGIKSNQSEAIQTLGPGVPLAYKYLPWGSVGECMKYLVRRAEENRSAVERTERDRSALRSEIGRRVFRM